MTSLQLEGIPQGTAETRLAAGVADGTVTIRFLGTAAFEIVTATGRRVLIDPYLEDNPVSPVKVADVENVDLILVTHAAYDHLGDTLEILRRYPDVVLLSGADVRALLIAQGIEPSRIWSSPWGMAVDVAGVRVRPVYSQHWSFVHGVDGSTHSSIPLGYIIYASATCRVYHTGDTALFSDLALLGRLYRPTVALVNVGVPEQHQGAKHGVPTYLTGEMDSREAALACEWLGVEVAIPCHHDDVNLPEVQEFASQLNARRADDPSAPRPVLLAPSETYEANSKNR